MNSGNVRIDPKIIKACKKNPLPDVLHTRLVSLGKKAKKYYFPFLSISIFIESIVCYPINFFFSWDQGISHRIGDLNSCVEDFFFADMALYNNFFFFQRLGQSFSSTKSIQKSVMHILVYAYT